MREEEILRSMRGEINARRRRGGALDVPGWLWDVPEVAEELAQTVAVAQESGFDGDWEEASLSLESSMDALAASLFEAAREVPSRHPVGLGWPVSKGHKQMSQEVDVVISLPDVVRHDAGGMALAEYFSWRLRNDGYGDWCRRTICGGEYVTREKAWDFLTSPLPKVLGFDDYERLGLCPVRTQGRLLSKYLQLTPDAPFFYTNMMFDAETGRSTATTDTLYGGTEVYCAEIILPDTREGERRIERLILHRSHDYYSYVARDYLLPKPYQVPGVDEDIYRAPLPAPFFPNGERFVEGYAQSVMGELIGAAHMLCESYPVSIWDMLEALLTGEIPPQPAIEAFCWETQIERIEAPDEIPSKNHHPDRLTAIGPVTLMVQPWVTPEALADAWRECRRSTGYSPSAIQADALRFVLSHTPPGEAPKWECLARQWRQERGGAMTRGQLHRLFERARNAVLPPCAEADGL